MLKNSYHIVILYLILTSKLCECLKCFTKFENYCACDTNFNKSEFSTFSYWDGLFLCSFKCSQTHHCVAYNFWSESNQCQLFNKRLKKFSVVTNCQYYFKEGGSVNNRSLEFSVDNFLIEFYINGENISVAKNFQGAKVWATVKTYKNLPDELYSVAVLFYNDGGPGGMIAKSSDGYVLTDGSWKCTDTFYEGWQKLDYNDSFWSDAIVGRRQTYVNSYPIGEPAKWISERGDCYDCHAYFYCKKNFIRMYILVICFLNFLIITTTTRATSNCFRRFEENGVGFCSCDRHAEKVVLSMFTSGQALTLCWMKCSQSSSCGLIAKTSDNYILTNSTWKCINDFYDGWFQVDYDDLFWPEAVVGFKQKKKGSLISVELLDAQWIVGPENCDNCTSDFYCRKKDIGWVTSGTC
ncbi:hypothetical protein HELRODRAFT_180245 [Helobdella robusta]|uniref:Apple domain-containing protein n=1 Tax=Helobdella robusta TaxID=6412 RepID=T1FFM3_HELRO|nr:hypothetical protein HELRODRAFT_180245 [Helobdella robusta]ESN94077.1 hypothetical protein HELRODRAFT_180245 [Helobdella robusta]